MPQVLLYTAQSKHKNESVWLPASESSTDIEAPIQAVLSDLYFRFAWAASDFHRADPSLLKHWGDRLRAGLTFTHLGTQTEFRIHRAEGL